ncbi:hypothetical protein IT413_00660 [Candidatus Peregrinibacteria bacterium]|nr:hypothetical protein [Candidatus Peregrinibacteria bacterium]
MDWSKIDFSTPVYGGMVEGAEALWPLIVFVLFATVLGAWVKKRDRATRRKDKS